MIKFDKETPEQRREILSNQLRKGVAEVVFTKVDGTVRNMPCTLNAELIPPAPIKETVKVKKENPAVMSVWCTDKSEWRSFRLENVISIG